MNLPDNQMDALQYLQRNSGYWISPKDFHCGPHVNSYAALVRRGMAERKMKGKAAVYRLVAPQVASMPYAYEAGNNPWTLEAEYHCHHCDLQLFGHEVGYIAAGPNYANGEHPPCPQCGRENSIVRGDED